jgi:hypothetical protein
MNPRMGRRSERIGIDWGSAFFGWVVAIAVAVSLTAVAIVLGDALVAGDVGGMVGGSWDDARAAAVAVLAAIALVSYLTGGYVAGRMSRFDGPRQGLAMWVFALLVGGGLALATAITGNEVDLVGRLDLLQASAEAGTGAIAIGALLVATLVAAITGGALGERYHRAIDRAAGAK